MQSNSASSSSAMDIEEKNTSSSSTNASSNDPTNYRLAQFEWGVDYVWSTWSLMELAINMGFGGRNTRDKVRNIKLEVLELFDHQKEVHRDEIEDLLYQAIEEDLHTVAEDGSVEMVADQVVSLRGQCLSGDFTLLETVEQQYCTKLKLELDKVREQRLTGCFPDECAPNLIPADEGESSESESEDEDGEEGEEEGEGKEKQPQQERRGGSGGEEKKKTEDVDEDGFTLVTNKRNKKKGKSGSG
ncbi:rRNA accumulation-related protein [Balamuthia mandrillaris]